MKKYFSILLIVVMAFGTILAGCSSSNEGASGDGSGSVEKMTIHLMGMNYGGMQKITEQMEAVGDSSEKFDIRTKLTDWGDLETQSKVVLSAGGESPYEILQAYNGWMPEYIHNGWILPLSDLYEKYKDEYELDDIPQELWDVVSANGEIYGVPYQQNLQHLFYRKDLFEKYGLEVPKTFDELFAVLDVLKEKGDTEHPIAISLGGASSVGTEFNNALLSYGGQWFDENDQPTFNSEEGLKSIEFLQKLMKYMPKEVLSFSNNDVSVALQQEQIAMTNIWTTRASEVEDETVSKVAGKIGYAPAVSAVEGGIPYTNWTQDIFVIPNNVSKDADVVFQAIAETLSKENTEELAPLTIVARSSVAESESVVNEHPNYKSVTETIADGAQAYPMEPYFNSARLIVGGYVAEVLAGNMSAEEALAKAEEEVISDMKTKGYLK